MNTTELKILAGEMVVTSKLDKQSKLQIINWLQNEATKIGVMGFLLDGRIQHFNGDVEQIVIDRFKVSEAGGRIAKLRKSAMSQSAAGGGIAPHWLIYRKIRSLMSACTKKCGTYEVNTTRRQHCMIKCKVQQLTAEVAAANKAGDKNKAAAAASKLAKAKAAMAKSSQSFQSRGANE